MSAGLLEKLSKATETFHSNLSLFYKLRLQSLEIEKEDKKSNNTNKGLRKTVQEETFKSQHKYTSCPFCGTVFTPDNHRVRLLPKMKSTKTIQKLLKRHEVKPSSLGKFQKSILVRYVDSSNKLCITCLICKKIVKLPGQRRSDRLQQIQTQQLKGKLTGVKHKSKKQKQREKKQEEKKSNKKPKVKHAGLIIPCKPVTSSVAMKITKNHGVEETSVNKLENKNHSDGGNSSVLTNEKHSETFLQSSTSSVNQHPQYDGKHLNLKKKKLSLPSRDAIIKGMKEENLPVSVRLKSRQCGKLKGKRQYKELGKILKAESQPKKPKNEGSLADFLSGL